MVFSTPIKFQRIKLKRESYYMKRIILTIGICIAFFEIGYGQILTFENSGLGGNEASTTSNSNDTNIASSTLSRGSGVNASNNGGRFNATSHSTESTLVTGDNSYFTFNINPNSGFSFSVTDIEFNFQRSGTGPKSFALRSSNDSFASNLGSEVTISDVTSTQTLTFTFSLSNITSNTEFRLYTYNAESTSGSGGIGDGSGNDIVVNGSTTSTGGVVSKLVVTQINSGNSPSVGTAFDVVVQTQDASDTPSNVSSDVNVTLTKATGTGTLGGTLTGTISSGSNSVTISGVTFDTNGSGISITASDDASSLTSGTSSTFNVLTAADQLVLVSVPTTGYTNTALSDFTVEARRSNDSSVDANYTNSITINKATGSGNIGGTTSSSASSGVATFSNVTFDASGGYTIEATDGSLTSSASSTITISTINTSPSIGDLFITEYADGTGSGNYIYEFLEIYNPTNEGVDVNGYTLRQRNSTQSLTFSSSTVIPSNGFLVVGRNSDESSFETFWSVTFSDKVTYVNGNNSFISLNGDEDYLIENGSGTNIDPATDDEYTAQTVSSSGRVARINFSGNTTSDYITGASSEATPGSLDAAVELTGNAGYRLLTTPVVTSYSSFLDPIWTQGATTGADETNGNPNVFTWSTSSSDTLATNWSGLTDLSGNITAGSGFLAYVYADDDYTGSSGSTTFPKTLSVSGTENGDGITPTINTTNDEWSLVGNPYASTIDWDNVNDANTTGTAYVWNPNDGSGAWDVWTGSTGDLTDGLIAPFQAFFIQNASSGTPSITFNNDDKTTGGSFLGKLAESEPSIIRMEIDGPNGISNSSWMEFSDEGSLESTIREAFELQTLAFSSVQFGFQKGDDLMDIVHLPEQGDEYSLPVVINSTESGEFLLSVTDFNLPSNLEVTFHDHRSGISTILEEGIAIRIDLESQAKAKKPRKLLETGLTMKSKSSDHQFSISVNTVATTVNVEEGEEPNAFVLSQNYPNPFNPSTTITYSLEQAGLVSLDIYNALGQRVTQLVNKSQSPGRYNIQWDASVAPTGIYYYRLEVGGVSLTRKMTLIK